MKKKVVLMVAATVMALSLVACGGKKDDDIKTENMITESDVTEADTSADAGNDEVAPSDGITVDVESDDIGAVRAAYQKVISNMGTYVENCEELTNTYIAKDYMYYDYDLDGAKELVLYLGYNDEDGEYKRDVVFMDYNAAELKVYMRATSKAELNDQSFYAEYRSEELGNVMARYSWVDVHEAYLYYVNVDEEGVFRFVLDSAYDELFSDLEGNNLYPLPLYGEWEIILPEE